MTQLDTAKSDPRTRRSVLAAGLGAVAASAAVTLARPLAASAADGDPLILGQSNQADTPTTLEGVLGVGPSLEVLNDVPLPNPINVYAILGRSVNGPGVLGESLGSHGLASCGVQGVAVNEAGVGVSAFNVEGGTALHVMGKARLPDRSGRATVLAGRSSVDIDLRQTGGLGGTPLCFANLMSYRPGAFVTTIRPNYPVRGKARIYLNRVVSANTFVSWLVLD